MANRSLVIFLGLICPLMHFSGLLGSAAVAQQVDPAAPARRQMVQAEVAGRGIRNPLVLRAMNEVPRHLFVPAAHRKLAYRDAALPLGYGQTITSPYVVAFMTDQLDPQPTDRILEIGTGSGYQASILSRIAADVYTIEIVEPLGKRAARTIEQLGYTNVHTKIGDGYQGWPEHAPYDKIIVTCSPEKVPTTLVNQLADGGRLIIPLGQRFQQTLYLFRKRGGQLQQEDLEATFFVPMTGQAEKLRVHRDESGRPRIVNGSFERALDDGNPEGWFYARRARVVSTSSAPDGQHVLTLTGAVAGQPCHAVQAFALDGRRVQRLAVSVWVSVRNISTRGDQKTLPSIELACYDENRTLVRSTILGPWQTDRPWTKQRTEIPVPGRTRSGAVIIGMFGATGQFLVDQLTIEPLADDQ